MNIYYGCNDKYIDITDKTKEYSINNFIFIPKGDHNSASIFGDPCFGIRKNIKVVNNGKETIYEDDVDVYLKKDNTYNKRKFLDFKGLNPQSKLDLIH